MAVIFVSNPIWSSIDRFANRLVECVTLAFLGRKRAINVCSPLVRSAAVKVKVLQKLDFSFPNIKLLIPYGMRNKANNFDYFMIATLI